MITPWRNNSSLWKIMVKIIFIVLIIIITFGHWQALILIIQFWEFLPILFAVFVVVFMLLKIALSRRKKARYASVNKEEALALELEDQLKELKEQLGLGHITQEEYEQKKKKLLEKSKA